MLPGKIYIITNDINNKIYVGQTVQALNIRWNQHKSKSNSKNYKISNAIRKYGAEHFKISLVENNILPTDLNEKEEEYIKLFNSVNEGYNIKYTEQRKRSLTQYYIDDIIVSYLKKETIKSIAKRYKADKKTISSILKENNVPIRNWNKEQSNDIICKEFLKEEYVNKHKSIREIATETNLSREAIRGWLKKFDLLATLSSDTEAIIGEKNWKAERLIRGEGYTKYNQPQRIDAEKI